MTMDGGRVVKSAPARARIYEITTAALMVLAALGIVRADEVDAKVLTNAITEVVTAVILIVARLNVKVRGAYEE